MESIDLCDKGLLPEQAFNTIIKHAPLVSIDFIIKNKNKILLGKRINRPAQGYWFVPGGRVRKNENLNKAFNRISLSEVGKLAFRKDAVFLGVYEHFYQDSMFSNSIDTHYIAIAYLLDLTPQELVLNKSQHSSFEWWDLNEACVSEDVNFYTKKYIQDLD